MNARTSFPSEPSSLAVQNGVLVEVVNSLDGGAADLPLGSDGATQEQVISLNDFISTFGAGLLDAVQQQNPPTYQGQQDASWNAVMDGLLRKPFEAQREVVHAVSQLLVTAGQPASVINAEMGTGKTMMGIAAAAVLHKEGFQRCLVIAPPHLVYKWRREIIETVPNAVVWVLNGSDTLRKLIALRAMHKKPEHPEFFILGRVRMRMGFNWEPAFAKRTMVNTGDDEGGQHVTSCASCGTVVVDADNAPLHIDKAGLYLGDKHRACRECGEPLWTLTRGKAPVKSLAELTMDAMCQIPSIGPKTAQGVLDVFGVEMISDMLQDNFHQFLNLMDDDGEFYFKDDRKVKRMERHFAKCEVSFGQGGYQPTEFIKRYLPKGYFGVLLVDEGHEYKNEGSAQGQAMGVLASQCKKTILLTGTLMGGYADDLFHLLFRLNPAAMMEDGFGYNERGSIGPGADRFMRAHGVMIDTYKSQDGESRSHRTARGNTVVKHSSKGPGFGPKGIMRYVVPITAFLKLKDIGGNVLPPYKEEFIEVPMDDEQRAVYRRLEATLSALLTAALRAGDHTLLGVVLNVLLAWPDCAFREENVYHPRHRTKMLACAPSLYADTELMPKERKLIALCQEERRCGRRVLVYTTYTGTRDTTARLKAALTREGFKVAVLKATVESAKREDWLADQVERGVDVIITNPELVKTGLDLLDFPTIVFMQTGYNVYTLQQAARRSWRIGQKVHVRVVFLGYGNTAQAACLTLMAKKIAVAQSTSGDMPESGLDILNQDGDAIEVALAKRLVG